MTTTPVPLEVTDEVRVELDRTIHELSVGAARWAGLSLAERAALLASTHASIGQHAATWAATAVAAKNTPANLAGEEWLSGPYVTLANVGHLAESVAALAAGRSPAAGLKTGTAPGNRTTVQVLPGNAHERLLLHGFSAEVWTEPGISPEEVRDRAGLGARITGENNGVGVVLGAGNISAIGPLDVLYELVAHNRTSVLKLNPTFASLLPVLNDAFAPLVEAGLMRVVNGGAAVGSYLTGHPDIVHVHITGAAITHDAIVWGAGSESAERRAAGTPQLTKEITSELGGVSPIIVVPGKWSKRDLRFQAENVVTQRLHNAGHNCIAGQTLIISKDWKQCDAFLAEVRAVMDAVPGRSPWYPGSDRKMSAARASYPAAEEHCGRLLVEVSDETSQDLLSTEYFSPVLGHVSLPGTGVDFLRRAVEFAETRLDGSLGASLVIKPADRRRMGEEFDHLITALHYGTIAVNAWSALGFLAHGVPWGAFPGGTLAEVGSGIGVVHNSYLLADTERTVITGPFRPFPRSFARGEFAMSPKPGWFVTAKTGAETAELLTAFATQPRWRRVPKIFASALKG
jgi:acyl-CoA reductase-like NAD-dependent aldehyde dehydrogenase